MVAYILDLALPHLQMHWFLDLMTTSNSFITDEACWFPHIFKISKLSWVSGEPAVVPASPQQGIQPPILSSWSLCNIPHAMISFYLLLCRESWGPWDLQYPFFTHCCVHFLSLFWGQKIFPSSSRSPLSDFQDFFPSVLLSIFTFFPSPFPVSSLSLCSFLKFLPQKNIPLVTVWLLHLNTHS